MQVSVRNLTPAERAAWQGFLRVHASLVHELDRGLEAEVGLPLRDYEVLLHLGAAPDGRLRMSDLAASVLLSPSGVTRLVDRLVADGLVERVPCDEDRRGLWAHLTGAGAARLAEARPVHLAGVRAHLLDRFSERELLDLAAVWERIVPGATR